VTRRGLLRRRGRVRRTSQGFGRVVVVEEPDPFGGRDGEAQARHDAALRAVAEVEFAVQHHGELARDRQAQAVGLFEVEIRRQAGTGVAQFQHSGGQAGFVGCADLQGDVDPCRLGIARPCSIAFIINSLAMRPRGIAASFGSSRRSAVKFIATLPSLATSSVS
jgi:hypothetical protein